MFKFGGTLWKWRVLVKMLRTFSELPTGATGLCHLFMYSEETMFKYSSKGIGPEKLIEFYLPELYKQKPVKTWTEMWWFDNRSEAGRQHRIDCLNAAIREVRGKTWIGKLLNLIS